MVSRAGPSCLGRSRSGPSRTPGDGAPWRTPPPRRRSKASLGGGPARTRRPDRPVRGCRAARSPPAAQLQAPCGQRGCSVALTDASQALRRLPSRRADARDRAGELASVGRPRDQPADPAAALGGVADPAGDRAWSNEAATLTARVVLSVRPYGATRAIVRMASAILSSLSRMRLPGQRSGLCHIPTQPRCHDACGLLA